MVRFPPPLPPGNYMPQQMAPGVFINSKGEFISEAEYRILQAGRAVIQGIATGGTYGNTSATPGAAYSLSLSNQAPAWNINTALNQSAPSSSQSVPPVQAAPAPAFPGLTIEQSNQFTPFVGVAASVIQTVTDKAKEIVYKVAEVIVPGGSDLSYYKTNMAAGYDAIAEAGRQYNYYKSLGDLTAANSYHDLANRIRDAMGVSGLYDRVDGSLIVEVPGMSRDSETGKYVISDPVPKDPYEVSTSADGNQLNPLKDLFGIGKGGTVGQGMDGIITMAAGVGFIMLMFSLFRRG